jgi:hypothetical protein
MLRRGSTPASSTPAGWQRSEQESGADIRFKRPRFAATGNDAAQPVGETSTAAAAQPRHAPRIMPTVRQFTFSSTAASPALEQPVDQDAGVAFRPLQGLVQQVVPTRSATQVEEPEHPVVTQAIASAPPQANAAPSAAASNAPIQFQDAANQASAQTLDGEDSKQPETRFTDEQLQLVSRILADPEVARAMQEESLPPAPGDANSRTSVNRHEKSGLELDDSSMYYGECCPSPPPLFWIAGVEATFLSPDLNSNGVSLDVEEIDESRHDICSTLSNDVDSVYVAPRIWLGVQGCKWGTNLRYWHLQGAEGAFDPSIGGLGTWDDFDCGVPDFGFMTCSNLEAYTIDLELTRRFCLNHCAMQAAVGVRHAEIEHNEALWGLANTDEGLLTGFARANRLSRGTGLQFGLYGRRPIFPCSCVHWFYNARWSALWGPTQTSVETFASVQTNPDPNLSGSAASVNGAYTSVDDTLFIGEIQLGLEWDYCLRCIPANAFFRAAIEYQRWDGGQGFSASQSFAGATIITDVDPTSIITANASAAEPQMDLFGISLGTGLTW